jgi:hypothetical protein
MIIGSKMSINAWEAFRPSQPKQTDRRAGQQLCHRRALPSPVSCSTKACKDKLVNRGSTTTLAMTTARTRSSISVRTA